ncbi:MAG: LacI family transcriptional regulator [Acidobacteria bacterium]|nr:MAG: LacI family transcriptional regulator [Acidobacteriota bacterium]
MDPMGARGDIVRRRRKADGPRRPKPPGIREMAKALGVSIGTVDRALHDRPGINERTRAKILDLAGTLGYRPNLAARFLSSRKQCRVGVNLPREIASFFDLVRGGIEDVARSFESNGVRVVYRSYPRLGEGETEALEAALDDGVDGLVIAPGRPEELAPLMRRAMEQDIPVVCVNTDAPGIEHLATVSVDSATSGALVGELMGRFLGGEGRVVVVTGQISTVDHRQKLEGFRKELCERWPGLSVAAVVEAHDDEAEAYEKCRGVLESTDEVAGVYVSTANSMPVMRALDGQASNGKVTIVTTDLFPALAPLVDSGRVAATIYQRPWVQGQIAFQAIYKFLMEGVTPPAVHRLSPHVVMRSNLKLFLDRMRSDSGRGSIATFADEIR